MTNLNAPVSASILVIFLFLPLLVSAGDMQRLQQGQQAFNAGNYALSFALWLKEAQQGNSEAQVFVGLSCANGWGVPKDKQQASIWYAQAAYNKNPSGQLLLGLYYLLETGQDRAAGLTWVTLAAQAGEPQAQGFLDKGYAKGWFNDIKPVMAQQTPEAYALGPLALADNWQ